MARTPDPDSATAQFFITVTDNKFLDKAQSRDGAGYCVFGKVIDGMDVVDKIKAVETSVQNGMENVPVKHEGVLIKSMHRAEAK
jgi:peptidyl-prolyl cis-trans isomerase A (cyclophilin A)